MARVYLVVAPSVMGRVCFAFDSTGCLATVELCTRRKVGEAWQGSAKANKGQLRPPKVPRASALEKWLKKYFQGVTSPFPGDWSIPKSTPFRERVYQTVAAIPSGKTMTYGEVATACGSPGAARAVGSAMAQNPIPVVIPCHRVLAANGLGGFTGRRGVALKADLLALEGAKGLPQRKGKQ